VNLYKVFAGVYVRTVSRLWSTKDVACRTLHMPINLFRNRSFWLDQWLYIILFARHSIHLISLLASYATDVQTLSVMLLVVIFAMFQKLKLIDRLRVTHWTPPDYWQTNNSDGLVMVFRNYHWLNSASWVLISTGSNRRV